MRKPIMVGVVVLAVLFPRASHAQFSLGARVGYGFAMGDVAEDQSMSDFLLEAQIPIQIDAMFRLLPDFEVGAYFSYGFGRMDLDGGCDISGVDCTGNSTRLGVQAAYSLRNASPSVLPWIGAGVGYEWARAEAERPGARGETKVRGVEFLNLQGGADFRMAERFWVGPFVQFSLGQYSRFEDEFVGTDPDTGLFADERVSGSIPDKAMHQWLTLGVRGKFDM